MDQDNSPVTKKSSRILVGALAALALSSILAIGCSGNPGAVEQAPAEAEAGALTIALTATPDIEGFQIDIARANGTVVSSQFVANKAGVGSSPKSRSSATSSPTHSSPRRERSSLS